MILTEYNPQQIIIPIYGQISAGKPLDATPVLGWRKVRVPKNYRPGEHLFVLQVLGDSLRDDAIVSGDWAICLATQTLQNGKLAAVLVNGGMTMKYVFLDPDGTVWLEGAHPNHPAKAYRPEDVEVQAQVIRIERDL